MAEAFMIKVTYNGVTKDLQVQPEEQMQAVLQKSINLFSLQRQPHQMGLFTEANVQVAGPNINQSVEQAGLQAGQLLVLKQVVVEGGEA
jgi:aerobic-type carbon monoxide dehydrogenase small subunit (CoxS/CutS family)